jgi:hypothetical protein
MSLPLPTRICIIADRLSIAHIRYAVTAPICDYMKLLVGNALDL